MYAYGARLLCLTLLLGACAQPQVLRDGVLMSYEQAADADLFRAREYIAAGQPQQALPVLERLVVELASSRRADEALFLLGEVRAELGDGEQAVLAWRRLLERHPRSRLAPETRLQVARLYRDLGRPEIGRRILAEARFQRADGQLRVEMYRLLADLARAAGDYPEAVRALAHSLRDVRDGAEIFEIELELDELIKDRLRDQELEELGDRIPRGPVFDQVQLEIARRAIQRSEFDTAIKALDKLARRLPPREEAERLRLAGLAGAGARSVTHTLGLAVPLSGSYASFGESVLRGATLALGIFSDPPGRYRVLVRDTAGDRKRGAKAVRELAEKGVRAIIGPMRSVVAAKAAPVAERAHVPLLTLAPRQDLHLLGDFIFRLGISPSDQVDVLLDYAVGQKGYSRFAILYPKDDFGTTFKNLFWDQVQGLGATVVGVEGYAPDAVDLQTEIRKLIGLHYITDEERELLDERDRLSRRPAENEERLTELSSMDLPPYVDFDALFIPDVARKVGLILPQLRFYDIRDVTFLGPSDWNDEKLVEIAGRDASGAVFAAAFYPKSQKPTIVDFVSRFRAAFGEAPDLFAAQGYDAAVILRTLIDRAGQISREQLRRELLFVNRFRGVSGLTAFDEDGGTRKELRLLTVHRGAILDLDELP